VFVLFLVLFQLANAQFDPVAEDACDPVKCPNTDCGSCGGTACCKIQIWFRYSNVEDIAERLSGAISQGIDGTFIAEITQDGDEGMSDVRYRENPDEDADFVGQLTRKLESTGQHYDLSFALQPRVGGVMLNVFSQSGAAGLYCDRGQNYANIMDFAESLGVKYRVTHMDRSCFKFTPDGEVLRRTASDTNQYKNKLSGTDFPPGYVMGIH